MHVLKHHEGIAGAASAPSGRDAAKGTDPCRRLVGLELFRSCSTRELHMIDALSTSVKVGTGRVLCREGDVGREFFVIVDGSVTVHLCNQPSRRLGPGEAFGELAIMDRGRRTATVTANEPTELRVFSVTEFASLLDMVPHVARELLAIADVRRRTVGAEGQGPSAD